MVQAAAHQPNCHRLPGGIVASAWAANRAHLDCRRSVYFTREWAGLAAVFAESSAVFLSGSVAAASRTSSPDSLNLGASPPNRFGERLIRFDFSSLTFVGFGGRSLSVQVCTAAFIPVVAGQCAVAIVNAAPFRNGVDFETAGQSRPLELVAMLARHRGSRRRPQQWRE